MPNNILGINDLFQMIVLNLRIVSNKFFPFSQKLKKQPGEELLHWLPLSHLDETDHTQLSKYLSYSTSTPSTVQVNSLWDTCSKRKKQQIQLQSAQILIRPWSIGSWMLRHSWHFLICLNKCCFCQGGFQHVIYIMQNNINLLPDWDKLNLWITQNCFWLLKSAKETNKMRMFADLYLHIHLRQEVRGFLLVLYIFWGHKQDLSRWD